MSRSVITVLAAAFAAIVLQSGPAAATSADIETAFRMTKLELRDPHVFVSVSFMRYDVTSDLNFYINKQFSEDSSNDSYIDASFLAVFDPMNQRTNRNIVEISQGTCTAVSGGADCSLDSNGKPATVFYANKRTGTCATVLSRTTGRYSPAVAPVTGPCFYTEPATMGIDLAGIRIILESAIVSAKWIGEPATKVVGMVRGFVSLKTAAATQLPNWAPVVGGRYLSEVISSNDLDYGPDRRTRGIWLYFNFEATVVKVAE
ncbi:MAG: hypothetical protein MUC50_10345 [Myxococcota bacterium]|jgi:hypothetical protein|nr:hypothetical protein [Myxococcota bacterium]